MNKSEKFNYFAYPLILEAMDKKNIDVSKLSKLSNISVKVLEFILKNEVNFQKSTIYNIQALMSALDIPEQYVRDNYYEKMYDLGNDDSNVIAIYNCIDGSRNFKLSEDDFNLIVKLLERLAIKETNQFDVSEENVERILNSRGAK